MHDDETFDFFIRNSQGQVLKGRIDFVPYARLYYLMYRKPELEPIIAHKLSDAERIHRRDASEFVDEITDAVAYEHDVDLPDMPEGSMEEERWEIAWNKLRRYEWEKRQGAHA